MGRRVCVNNVEKRDIRLRQRVWCGVKPRPPGTGVGLGDEVLAEGVVVREREGIKVRALDVEDVEEEEMARR